MSRVIAFVRLGRPLFLGGGFLMFALGAAIAHWYGHVIDVHRYVLGQAAVTALQLMTHYANDFFDYEADRANVTPTKWSGGSRVLAADELPRGVAVVAAVVLALIGIAISIVLAFDAPGATLPTLVAMLVLAWFYSAPPLRLCATGLGELDTALVVTGLVPWLAFYLQAPNLVGLSALLLAIAPLAMLQFAMLLAIEVPDAAGDAATGKRTLVVRLGAERAARLYVTVTLAAYACVVVASALGPTRLIAGLLPLPVAIWRVARIADHRDPAAFERLTLAAVFLLVATAACELGALVVPL